MIRFYPHLCKHIIENLAKNDSSILEEVSGNIKSNMLNLRCPKCNAKGNFTSISSYVRTLISFANNKPLSRSVSISRVKCCSCSKTHAVLPSVIVPYSPFGIYFVLSLLESYFSKEYASIKELCEAYGISSSSLYRIKDRFLEDKTKMLCTIKDLAVKALELINSLKVKSTYLELDVILEDFYKASKVSFLQALCKIRPNPKKRKLNSGLSP